MSNKIRTYAVSGYSLNQVKAVSEVLVSEDRVPDAVLDLVKRGIDIIIIRKIEEPVPEIETEVKMEVVSIA